MFTIKQITYRNLTSADYYLHSSTGTAFQVRATDGAAVASFPFKLQAGSRTFQEYEAMRHAIGLASSLNHAAEGEAHGRRCDPKGAACGEEADQALGHPRSEVL